MCTASLITLPRGGYRLVINRDEQRDRADAFPPRWRTQGASRAIYPVDPVGGGTWAAATSSGLALCLLNFNLIPAPPLPAPERLVSRGRIILDALGGDRSASGTPLGAVDAIRRLDLEAFAPFRLLAVGPPTTPSTSPSAVEVSWDRRSLATRPLGDAPACLVSSGLGDAVVVPRLVLFAEMVTAAGQSPEAQDRFHRHTWPDRPEISVMMSRREARTVSVLSIEVRPGTVPGKLPAVTMRYEPVPASPAAQLSDQIALAETTRPE